jgi:coenzyme PQQ precursor peptide PqqA
MTDLQRKETHMKKTWNKPQISEQDVSLEITAYVAAELK